MGEPLTPLDTCFLLLERLWLPMHFGGLSLLDPSARPEGPITPGELHEAAARRLRRLPRLRQRVEFPRRGLGRPVWVPAPVDLSHHVRHHVLPESGGDLLQLVGRCTPSRSSARDPFGSCT